MPCRVNGLYRADSKVKGKEEAQRHNVWLQCFALYVGVLASLKPELVPDLMAYMISIVRASQEFEGSAWTVYDDACISTPSGRSRQPMAMVASEPILIHHLLYGKGQMNGQMRTRAIIPKLHSNPCDYLY